MLLEATREAEIKSMLQQCLEEPETVVDGFIYAKAMKNQALVPDLCLPSGCKRLKIKPNAVIEVKRRLVYDTVNRIYLMYKDTSFKEVVVIVDEVPTKIDHFSRRPFVTVWTYQQFRNKVNKVLGKNIKIEPIASHVDQSQKLLELASSSIRKNKVTLFLGAGVSASAGVVDWKGLLKQLVDKKGIQGLDEINGNAVEGRYIVDAYYKDKELDDVSLRKDIQDILYKNIKKSDLLSVIWDLIKCKDIEVDSVITYNYDDLLEQHLEKIGIQCRYIYDKARPMNKNELQVYHVHGCIPQKKNLPASNIVLGEKEYHKIYADAFNWGNSEQLHALCRTTCLFIGLSMSDPNLRRLLDISVQDSEVSAIHYAFFCKENTNDTEINVTTSIMSDFGINCIWYESYDQLPALLNSLSLS